ncbi:MAG TPA: serine/threonine-protein kinase [Gemmatimonadales bacterium]|nr:serine/threonine-protein kinase [Gemmatimonadales bacterium]
MALDHSRLRRRLQEALGDESTVGVLLGEGGFAAVFRVREKALKRDVAVKVVDLGLTPSPSLAERFVREARTIARLEHPHIVPIYKVGGHRNEVLYIVMRCVDGPSLRQLLEKYKRLSIRDAARITRQVADALGYAHRHGVVHRDIKPDNILLDASGHVLVSDFGIAKAAKEASTSHLTTEGMVVGTPQYMSPEQATGDRVDARSDIYSMGILLYQMLAGAPPFDGESAQSILMKQATATPAPIGRLRSDVTPALATLVDRLLAKDPSDRYQTADEVSRALVEALPAAARDSVRLRRTALSLALQSLVSLGVAGCLAAVAFGAGAVAVAFFVFSRPPRIAASAPLPDTLVQALRRQRALARGDQALYLFAPGGAEDTTRFLVARRAVAIVTPGRVRLYPRPGVHVGYGVDLRRGLQFRMVLQLSGARRDTVYRSLTVRDLYELVRRVGKLLPDAAGAGTVRLTPR